MIIGRVKINRTATHHRGGHVVVSLIHKHPGLRNAKLGEQIWGYIFNDSQGWFAASPFDNELLSGPYTRRSQAIRVCVLSHIARTAFPIFRFNPDSVIELPQA